MTKFNLEKCKSGNKGITLIALIITIIVLLILAGITIASLTGSDSAPAKANEAKQRNDIGSAKDQLAVVVQNAHLEAYDDIYVAGNETVKSTAANTTVGQRVINAALEKYGASKNMKFGDASIVVAQSAEGQDATVTITTRDFTETGKISIDGGTLSWNGTSGGKSTVASLAQAGTIKVGDYVNYTPSEGSVTVTSAQTGYYENEQNVNQTFSTANNSGMTWRVLSVNSSTGEVKIVGTPTSESLTLYGKTGFGNAETVLNSIAGIFGGGTGAATVRSITEDDVFDAIGYDKVANYKGGTDTFTSGELFTETWDETTGTATYSTTTTIATPENPVTLHNLIHNGFDDNGEWIGPGINTASQTLENGTTDEKENMKKVWDMLIGGNYGATGDNGNYDYWCASRFRTDWGYCGNPNYFVRYVAYGWINSGCFGEDLYGSAQGASRTHSVVPILILQSNIGIEKDTNNKWTFVTE